VYQSLTYLIIFQLTTLWAGYDIFIANSSLIHYLHVIADINAITYMRARIHATDIHQDPLPTYKRGGFSNEWADLMDVNWIIICAWGVIPQNFRASASRVTQQLVQWTAVDQTECATCTSIAQTHVSHVVTDHEIGKWGNSSARFIKWLLFGGNNNASFASTKQRKTFSHVMHSLNAHT